MQVFNDSLYSFLKRSSSTGRRAFEVSPNVGRTEDDAEGDRRESPPSMTVNPLGGILLLGGAAHAAEDAGMKAEGARHRPRDLLAWLRMAWGRMNDRDWDAWLKPSAWRQWMVCGICLAVP